MRTIRWSISLGLITEDGEFEVEDDTTDDEIESMAKEEAFNYIDWWWEVAL